MFKISKLAKTSLKVVMGAVGAQAIAIAVLPLFARLIDAEDFGRFGIWLGAVAICAILAGSKLQIPIVNERAPARIVTGVSAAMLVSLLVAAGLTGAGWILEHQVSHWMASWSIWYSLALGVAVWLTVVIQCMNAVATAQGDFRRLIRQRLVVASSVAICQLAVVIVEPSGLGLVIGFVAGSALGSCYGVVVSYLPMAREVTVSITGMTSWLRAQVTQLAFTTPAELISTAVQYLPVMILGARFGADAAGLMAMTMRVLSAPATLICGSLLDVYKHAAASEYESSGQCLQAYRETLRLALPLAVAICLPVLLAGPWLFAVVLGEDWRSSGGFAQLLSVLLFLRVLSNPVSHTIYLVGKAHLEMWWQVVLLAWVLASLYLGPSAYSAVGWYTASYSTMYLFYLMISFRAARGAQVAASV